MTYSGYGFAPQVRYFKQLKDEIKIKRD